jgi:hypothetical protein
MLAAPFANAELCNEFNGNAAHMIDAFRQGLNETGYVVGQNVAFEHRAISHGEEASEPRARRAAAL